MSFVVQYAQIDGARYELEPLFSRCDVFTKTRGYTRTVYRVAGLGLLVALIGGRVCEVTRYTYGVYDVVRVLPE